MPSSPTPSPRFLTLDDVAVELNVSRAQVYALVRDKSLLAIEVGGRDQWRVEAGAAGGLHRQAVRRRRGPRGLGRPGRPGWHRLTAKAPLRPPYRP